MKKAVKNTMLRMGAGFAAGAMLASSQAYAGGNNFSKIGENVVLSIATLPGLLTGLSYMLGIVIGVLGVLKIKDHVENPNNTPLKDGAIRLAAGGGLFALPIIYEAMFNTVGSGIGSQAAQLNKVQNLTK